MGELSTRTKHRRYCPDAPHPEDTLSHVFSRGDFKRFATGSIATLGLECLMRHLDASGVNPRVVLAPRALVVEGALHFEGTLMPDLRELHAGRLDWVLLPVHYVRDRTNEGHAMLFALCSDDTTGRATVSIRMDIMDPNGGRGFNLEEYERITRPLLRLFAGVALRPRVILLPKLNDWYDAELRQLDIRHGLTRLTTHASGFCAVWVFAFVLDICCSRSREVTVAHVHRLRDRAAGDANLSTRKRRYNTLMYLRSVLSYVVAIMREDHAARDASELLATFTKPVTFEKLRSTFVSRASKSVSRALRRRN